MEGRYFEEFNVGDKFATMGRTLTETDIVNFVALAGFYEELFMNMEYVKNESVFQKRIAPGPLVYSIAEGLLVASGLVHGTGMAHLGLKEMKITAPVACNDTISVEIEVIEKNLTKKPGRGIITFKHEVKNQKNETVMVFLVIRMIKCKG